MVSTRGQLVDARDRLYLAETMPTLIVWGERDAVIPVNHAHDAHEAIPGSRLEVFGDAGHVPQLDDPERFAAAVGAFVEETEPSSASEERWLELLRAGG